MHSDQLQKWEKSQLGAETVPNAHFLMWGRKSEPSGSLSPALVCNESFFIFASEFCPIESPGCHRERRGRGHQWWRTHGREGKGSFSTHALSVFQQISQLFSTEFLYLSFNRVLHPYQKPSFLHIAVIRLWHYGT